MSYYFSTRMRESFHGEHVGGAERLVPEAAWRDAMCELSTRAHKYPVKDQVHIISEMVSANTICRTAAMPNRTIESQSVMDSREKAKALLAREGIPYSNAAAAMELLDSGPGPGGKVM